MGLFSSLFGSSGGFSGQYKRDIQGSLGNQRNAIEEYIHNWNPGAQFAAFQNTLNRNHAAMDATRGKGFGNRQLGGLADARAGASLKVNARDQFMKTVPGLWSNLTQDQLGAQNVFYNQPKKGLVGKIGQIAGLAQQFVGGPAGLTNGQAQFGGGMMGATSSAMPASMAGAGFGSMMNSVLPMMLPLFL